MYSDWQAEAQKHLAKMDALFTPETTWQERQSTLRQCAWKFHGGTSWGQKVWAKHCRNYLALHGKPQPAKSAPLFADDIVFPFRASVDRNPQGEKPQALSAEHESAAAQQDAQKDLP